MSSALGIDPGLHGAAALIQDGRLVWVLRSPVRYEKTRDLFKARRRARTDLAVMSEIAEKAARVHLDVVAIEEVLLGMYGRGTPRSTAGVAWSVGAWEGVLAAQGVKVVAFHVPPKAWQAAVTAGAPGDTPKERSLWMARHTWPERKWTHDGESDAALIALWAYRRARRELT